MLICQGRPGPRSRLAAGRTTKCEAAWNIDPVRLEFPILSRMSCHGAGRWARTARYSGCSKKPWRGGFSRRRSGKLGTVSSQRSALLRRQERIARPIIHVRVATSGSSRNTGCASSPQRGTRARRSLRAEKRHGTAWARRYQRFRSVGHSCSACGVRCSGLCGCACGVVRTVRGQATRPR